MPLTNVRPVCTLSTVGPIKRGYTGANRCVNLYMKRGVGSQEIEFLHDDPKHNSQYVGLSIT